MLHATPDTRPEDTAVLAAIDDIRGTLRHSLARPRRWSGSLRRQARARAVRGSNTIEGITVSEDEAFAIVGQEEDQVALDPTWFAIKGYSDAMTYSQVLGASPDRVLDESALLALHFMVQGYDLTLGPGTYRRGDIHVRDEDASRTVYTGPDAERVPELMAEYVRALDRMVRDGVHPMIQGAMAHLNLVMIHPFADGNGRMSRILQSLMLYREQVLEAEFVSIEEYLGHHTHQYYEVLAAVGGGRWSPERSAVPWIEFVLTAHYRQARTIQRRLWQLDRIAEHLDEAVDRGLAPARALPALELAYSGWTVRNATYRELAEVSTQTASRELNALVGAGLLRRHGAKRGTWYTPSGDQAGWLEDLRAQAQGMIDTSADPYRLTASGVPIPTGAAADDEDHR